MAPSASLIGPIWMRDRQHFPKRADFARGTAVRGRRAEPARFGYAVAFQVGLQRMSPRDRPLSAIRCGLYRNIEHGSQHLNGEREGWIHTVEYPSAGVVGNYTQCNGVSLRHLDGITTHWIRLAFHDRWVQRHVVGRIVLCTVDYLHLVAVKMATNQGALT